MSAVKARTRQVTGELGYIAPDLPAPARRAEALAQFSAWPWMDVRRRSKSPRAKGAGWLPVEVGGAAEAYG